MFGTILNWLGGGILTKLAGQYFSHLEKKANSRVESERVAAEERIASLNASKDAFSAMAAMKYFWFGWMLFVFTTGVWYAKVVIWDKVLGLGTTDPLTGAAAQWAELIVQSMFLPASIAAVGGAVATVYARRR